MPIPPKLFEELTSALKTAGRRDLVRKLRPYRAEAADLTSKQAATLLGVSSANTVKNWLKGGHFPGAYKTAGGHWRFPRAEVLAARKAMNQLEERNLKADFMPGDAEHDEPIPLL